ncbi:MAG: nitrilase-related carbon-nitrogen hydrolase [Candidatus Aquilonibacter sp.]
MAARTNGERSPSRYDVRLVQVKPAKGRYRENLVESSEIFEQIAAEPTTPDLIVFPEAAMTGYFLEGAVYDLARPATVFAEDLVRAWRAGAGEREVELCCGFYENDNGTYHNSAIYLRVGRASHEIVHVHRKMFLPTYGVFDEERFLSRGRRLQTFETRIGRVAILICEDIWHAIMPTIAAIKGARVLIVPSAAPGRGIEGESELTSITHWREILRSSATEHGVFVLYAGLTGFEGGKGMTGSSCIIDPRGVVNVEAPEIGECVVSGAIDLREADLARATLPLLGDLAAVLPDLLLDEELPLPKGRP